MMWEMEKTVAGNGRKNSGGIRAAGRIRGKTAGRRIAAQQKIQLRIAMYRIMNISIIMVQETEHRIICRTVHSHGTTTRSRIILEGMAILNGITTFSRIIIFKVTIVSKAIIHSGIVNIK